MDYILDSVHRTWGWIIYKEFQYSVLFENINSDSSHTALSFEETGRNKFEENFSLDISIQSTWLI